jgi:hypothetical protein
MLTVGPLPFLCVQFSAPPGRHPDTAVWCLSAGVVLAVRGVHEPGGDFVVSAICFPGMAPNPHLLPGSLPTAEQAEQVLASAAPGDKYIAIASGFCLGGSKADMLKVRATPLE